MPRKCKRCCHRCCHGISPNPTTLARVVGSAHRSTFATPEQALAEALFLALMAPGESEAEAASMLAEALAVDFGLDEQTVEPAKAAALERFEHEAGELP